MTMKRQKPGTKRVSAQHANMRRKNESLVLSLLQRDPGLPSADIARRVGLAPQTISVVLKRLIDEEVLQRGEALRGRRGQPAVPISLNPNGAFSIGIEIGWRHADVVLINLTGEVLSHSHWEVPYHDGVTLIYDLIAAVETCLEQLSKAERQKLKGIGIAKPRSMSTLLHVVGGTPADKARLAAIDIVFELKRHFKLPVTRLNDGIAACLAERTFGARPQPDDLLYLFIGTYLGAGLVISGDLLRQGHGEMSSFGSAMVPDADGNIRALHLIATVKALENRLAKVDKSVPRIRPVDWDWEAIEPEVEEWLCHAAHGLALAIANSCTVVFSTQAVIDGVLPKPILERLAYLVTIEMQKLPIVTFGQPKIVVGSLGEKAGAIGAAYLPLDVAIFAPEE